MESYEVKRLLFDIFENARTLFNDYYNGFMHNYTEEDKKIIGALISVIEGDIDNIKYLL